MLAGVRGGTPAHLLSSSSQGADAAESPANPIARMAKRARDSLIRCPFLSGGATRAAGSVDLLKGRDGDRMSIDSVKRPSRRCHENLLNRPARSASTGTFWIAIRSRCLYRGVLEKHMLGAQFQAIHRSNHYPLLGITKGEKLET
jgi:hypothetical protein